MMSNKKHQKSPATTRPRVATEGEESGLDGGIEFGVSGELGRYGEYSPLYGLIGGAVFAETGILIAKKMRPTHPTLAKWAGLVGLGTGGVPSLVATFFDSTRAAGFAGLVQTAILAGAELLRSHVVEPAMGLYEDSYAGPLEILGDMDDDMMGPGGLEILGQPGLPALGMYQPEMTGPMEVMGSAAVPYA